MKVVWILSVRPPDQNSQTLKLVKLYSNLSISIRNYRYRINIWIQRWISKIKYDEYHYSTHHLLFISEFDPRIQFEKGKL
jgi:uncharacterized protein YjlB